jgi:hypothetical protein
LLLEGCELTAALFDRLEVVYLLLDAVGISLGELFVATRLDIGLSCWEG